MDSEYIIDPTYNGANSAGAETPLRSFKGSVDIIYNLSEVSQGNYEIIKIEADFNDGSPIIIKNYEFGKNLGSELITHTLRPSNKTNTIIYYSTLYITFSNFKRFIYQTPILVAQESFYTLYKNLDIASCQFLDNSENHLFVTFDTENGDILNLIIK